MIDAVGGSDVAGEGMKEKGTDHWNYPKIANNGSHLTLLGSGYHDQDGSFGFLRGATFFFTSTAANSYEAWTMAAYHDVPSLLISSQPKPDGQSARCIKDYPKKVRSLRVVAFVISPILPDAPGVMPV